MPRFAVGEIVDKATDDHSPGVVASRCFQLWTALIDMPSPPKDTVRCNLSSMKNWCLTPLTDAGLIQLTRMVQYPT
jgi:hypothetical protein